MMSDMERRERLRAFVADLLRARGDLAPFGDEDSLVLTGRLNSLDVVEVVGFMEAELGVDFDVVEFDRDAFDTLNRMLALLPGAP
jgi:acyl carrier protein